MGIVVCVCMLLGLVVLRPTPWSRNDTHQQSQTFRHVASVALLVFGLWNVVYGFRHFAEVWGWVGLASGVFMILGAAVIAMENDQAEPEVSTFKTVVTIGLGVFFLLYAVTLIQLNLGYPILG